MRKKLISKGTPQSRKRNLTGFLFASPWILGFVALSLVPIVLSFYYSFCDYSIFQPATFTGIKNYVNLFHDDLFWTSVKNTVIFTLLSVPLNIIISLLLALLLNLRIRGQSIFRACYYLPSIIPVVASSILWRWMYNSKYGLINIMLGFLNIQGPMWLQDALWTKPAMVLMGVWTSGNIVIIFLASLDDVPQVYYDAARVDGANVWQRFWNVTFPGISSVVLFQVVVAIINALQYFTQAYTMLATSYESASGGPGNSMLFYSLRLFYLAFTYYDMGSACAMAWILFIVVCIVTVLLFRSSRRWVYYDAD